MLITKSDLLRLRKCPNWFWLKKRDPQSIKQEVNRSLIEEGNEFELVCRELFPDGWIVKEHDEHAAIKTKQLTAGRDRPIFQATFLKDDVLVRTDVLVPVEDDAWDLFEIKASTEVKEEYLIDLAIQQYVLASCGVKLNRCGLTIANPSYIRDGELEIEQLIWTDDLTQQVAAIAKTEVPSLIDDAKRIVDLPSVPVSDIADLSCVPSGANACGCAADSYADLPEFSVFDVTRLPRESCTKLLRSGIREIKQITPRSIKLTKQQAIQVVLTHQEATKVQEKELQRELDSLKYPLYFLDYETFNFAVPPLSGFRSFQQFVFQYSLHVQREPQADLEHYEFLADAVSDDQVDRLCESLQLNIADDGGSVLVWHRSFEETRNKELGTLRPEYESFFRDINRRVFDLEDVFKNGLYLDYRFKGRSSIKVVLPVLCPEFSYKSLSVQNGGQAMETWHNMIFGGVEEDKIAPTRNDLLAYCELDTLAMVRIYAHLLGTLGDSQEA